MESDENGEGDEEIVRTALYVARLAQTKAKRARQCVVAARQEHAAALDNEETMDATQAETGNHHDAIFGISKILQQVNSYPSIQTKGSSNLDYVLNFRAPVASEAPSLKTPELQSPSAEKAPKLHGGFLLT
eukprot:scaffold83656_cov34-Prasinocladus_malaysianus.AAC.1